MKAVPDTKKAVVLAALLQGQGVNEIAAKYQIPKSTVSRLKKAIPNEELERIGTQKADELSALIAENLSASYRAIGNILRQTENAQWLNEQPASELATFLGVTSDKVFRVLEAIENAQTKADDEA